MKKLQHILKVINSTPKGWSLHGVCAFTPQQISLTAFFHEQYHFNLLLTWLMCVCPTLSYGYRGRGFMGSSCQDTNSIDMSSWVSACLCTPAIMLLTFQSLITFQMGIHPTKTPAPIALRPIPNIFKYLIRFSSLLTFSVLSDCSL